MYDEYEKPEYDNIRNLDNYFDNYVSSLAVMYTIKGILKESRSSNDKFPETNQLYEDKSDVIDDINKRLPQVYIYNIKKFQKFYFEKGLGVVVNMNLKHEKTVLAIIKTQLVKIRNTIRELNNECKIEDYPEAEHKKVTYFNQFRQIHIECLHELVDLIYLYYGDSYLKDVKISEIDEILNRFNQSAIFNKVAQKIALIKELGIIDYLQDKHPSLVNETWLANIIATFVDGDLQTIRKEINDFKNKKKAIPKATQKKIDEVFTKYEMKKG